MIHPQAVIQTKEIGLETHIGQFSVISPESRIGSRCLLGVAVFVGNGVSIADDVIAGNGSQLTGDLSIAHGVNVGANVVFLNSQSTGNKAARDNLTIVHKGAEIGANSTILPSLTIGRQAYITPGSVVTRDVPSYAIVTGNPASISGYKNQEKEQKFNVPNVIDQKKMIRGIDAIKFNTASDLRGDLMAVEFSKHIPFPVKRTFFVTNVPSCHVRGEHGHKECHQLLVCVQGSLTVSADNGSERGQWILDDPSIGLHIHPMVWAAQYHSSGNAVLAVFASHSYDADDYIRDYESFLDLVKQKTESHE